MPIHDWSNVDDGVFHYFHQAWTIEFSYALNAGVLPEGFFALAEQVVSGPIPDVITLQRGPSSSKAPHESGGMLVAEAPPRARFIRSAEQKSYVHKANRITIRHKLGKVVAVIEIVSPGNKGSRAGIRSFVEKMGELLREEINLLVVDLFPPSSRDPQGIHKAIWDEVEEEPFEQPADKPLTVAAYAAAPPPMAYVEPVAVGDALPSLPIFLDRGTYVPAPLESSYQTTWSKCPAVVKEVVQGPAR
ncbi:MAG TPA: DUF4058 family protein [Tepidisphaeraceae bacterium]|nr:DUF4058 family protein [Tepidisphaeraceae bacterium]